MSAHLRPVIEKWGESHNYGPLKHHEVIELIDAIADLSAEDPAGRLLNLSHADYDDMERVAIFAGARFLDYLERTSEADFCTAVLASDLDELTGEQYTVYEELRGLVPAWRNMIDPEDGSLRFYVD